MGLKGDKMERKMTTLADRFLMAKRELFDILYGHLNPMQRKAVFTVKNPLLILAGAGSGKTTVLVNRIAYIIKFGNSYYSDTIPYELDLSDVERLENAKNADKEEIEGLLKEYAVEPCPPWGVLAITFTNKAAKEIAERLERDLNEAVNDIWSGTFHSVCLKMLRKFGDRIGLAKSSLTIYDTDDTKKLVSSCMKELNIDEKMLNPKLVRNEISRAKDKLITPEAYAKDAFDENGNANYRLAKIASVYKLYQQKLSEANAVDFDDIIMKTVELLQNDEETRLYYQRKFKYVCIDEYQDTNKAQFVLASILAGGYNNIMAVGDDDQSIYKFRGATIENILNFDKTFENVSVIKLEQNYRSTKHILDAANSVIRNNIGRRGKELWTDKDGGERLTLRRCDNQIDEAKYIINKIVELVIKEKRRYSDFAILCRMNVQSSTIENVFVKSGVPFRMLCGTRFYERKEVKDILSYLCLINNPDDNLRLRRIVNEPKRKLGDTTMNAVEKIAVAENCSMFTVMKNCKNYRALSQAQSKILDFVYLIEGLRKISETAPLNELVEKTIRLSGYENMLLLAGEEEKERLENVLQMISNAEEYMTNNPDGTLSSYLEEVSLVADIDNYDKDADAVTIMTVHSAKGLEFPVVFIPGLEEGIFPGGQNVIDEEVEEERRLCYVAITRARERLICTHVKERMVFGQTQYNRISRFLEEIPEDYTVRELSDAEKAANEQKAAFKPRRKIEFSGEFIKKPEEPGRQKAANISQLSIGDRVRHITFGEGTLLSLKPMGADILYEIAFDNAGTKKLMATYAKLKKI
ncbi:MAG: ATP-dependent DNA helicase PcrA [Ruminococcaceae bacterium]|nr:ATP-dependent DNA helicase PcrA [Oscillospiraceae bacterium]